VGDGTITTLEWSETTWDGKPAGELVSGVTVVAVTASIEGTIDGRISDRWLMSYGRPGTAEFTGLTEVTGTVEGRTGTVVLRHVGRMENGNLRSEFVVAAGSGTGDLAGLTGTGTVTFTAPDGPTRYTFEPSWSAPGA
jgi:hypothetical protein